MPTGPETLEKLLENRVSTRSTLSFRLSLAIVVSTSFLMFDLLWCAIALGDQSDSTSLYGLFGVYVFIFICSTILCIYNYKNDSKVQSNSLDGTVRVWHKQGYRMLLLLVVLEHCLFFCSLPIMVYHSLGLSLSECLFQRSCSGIDYNTWVTTRTQGNTRTQRFETVPVNVYLTDAVMAMFGGYIVLWGFGIVQIPLYMYLEKKRVTESTLSYINRYRLLCGMALTSLALLLFSIVGLSVIKTNWFVLSLVLSIISIYPLYRLKKCFSKKGKITRLFFRNIAQISISLLFIFLYCSGSGVATSLIVSSPYHVEDNGFVISASAVAQLAILICVHVIFSVLSAVALYVHLSLSDMLWSSLQTANFAKQRRDSTDNGPPVIVDDFADKPESVVSVLDWGHRMCASCSSQATNTTLVPCGHSVLCKDCSQVLLTIVGFKCPLCCLEVVDVVSC